VLNNVDKETNVYNYIKLNVDNYCKYLMNNIRNRRLSYIYYKKTRYINKLKFTYTYLQDLKKELEELYNKQIEFNLIELKRFYLNSDILLESVKNKIRKKRNKALAYITKINNKIIIKRRASR
jgi:hypothetical protein